eukprot:2812695-Pleurochrysis_carterae.AAC.4
MTLISVAENSSAGAGGAMSVVVYFDHHRIPCACITSTAVQSYVLTAIFLSVQSLVPLFEALDIKQQGLLYCRKDNMHYRYIQILTTTQALSMKVPMLTTGDMQDAERFRITTKD